MKNEEFGRAASRALPARVGLFAPSPSGILPHPRTRGARWCVIHALRWFRYYPSRAASRQNMKYAEIGLKSYQICVICVPIS
jgi:hypothetical protein